MEWLDYAPDDDLEGGVLEFDSRVELHVYRRPGGEAAEAVWLSDDALYVCRVEPGLA